MQAKAMLKISLLASFMLAFSFSSSAQNLLAEEGQKEMVYVFSYLSPGSHAMVHSANAWEFMTKSKGVHKGAKVYRVPYIESEGHPTRVAAKAYFILRQLVKNRAVDHFRVEPKLYSLFKSEVVTEERVKAFFVDEVDGLSSAEVDRLSVASEIYVKHSLSMQPSINCNSLPCALVNAGKGSVEVNLDLNANDPLTEFWENVSIILL
jgi:hypothetical protein